MNKIGVIDIGSNSVHLVVADCNTAKGHFTILDDAKVNVRLCEGLSETGLLREDRMVLGVETLEMFKSMCDAYHVDQMEAVATAAVRKADNGGEFVRRVQEACGVAIKVIPGETEAAMDYLGTVNTIDVTDALLMDIGGGSVEFVRIADRRKVDAISLPFGSIDLMERFGLGDEADPKKIAQLEAFIEGALIGQPMFKAARHLPVLGVGGTIRNIGRIHRRMTDYPLEIAHNYVMTADEVASVCREADELDLEGRKNLKGLSSGRSDIFVGASHAVLKVLDFIGSDQLIISDAGLRDGVLFNEFGKGEDHLVPDVFEASLSRAVDNLGVEAGHARHVCNLARQLFIALAPLHKEAGEPLYHIAKASAMLHDSGIRIQYDNHHEHSFYLILNAGLNGLSQKEILMSAFVALNHRTNKKIKIDPSYQTLLDDRDKEIIDLLSLFLQIAEYLDRSMNGVVRHIACDIGGETVTLQVESVGISVFTNMIISECGKKFKRVLGRELKICNRVIPEGEASA